MKKKLGTIFILVLLPFILSGCVKVDTEVTLDKNGHAQVESKFLASDALSDSLDNEFFEIEI